MAQEIHFEVFTRQGSKGAWKLHDVATLRDAAIKMAEEQMKDGGATGVKVIKETYNEESGDYLTLKIFEDGHNKVKSEPAAEDVPHALPCFKPDDLYSYHARATIARLLGEFLARQKLTVTELLHRADALEKLEATGTVFQHAIQKIAVAQASSTSVSVQQIVKSLNELTTKAMNRVYRDARKVCFPDVQPGKFGAFAAKASAESDGLYLLNGTISRHLRPAKTWNEKLSMLLALMGEAEKSSEGAGRTLLLSSVDTIISELLNGSAALHELIGESENLGAALMSLVQLFLGKPQQGSANALNLLAEHFAKDELGDARTAVASRILAELKSVKRLCPNSVVDELKALRQIANRLVLGLGKYLSHEDVIAAFTLRSKRLITHESIGAHLNETWAPDEKLERLFFIEENIVGVENKRQLASFVMPILSSPTFEAHLLLAKTPVLPRLQRLAELQARVRRSGFQDNQKQEIGDALDKIANEAELRGKLLESIETKPAGHVEKAIAVLRLFTGDALTEGRLSARARELILKHLSKPGFLAGYVEHLAKLQIAEKPTAESAMNELMQTLGKAGITAETGLKSIAA
ncbi:MAG: hypothetical protein HY243_07340 [Proteobacteria bacterium]|nr:hypothetical protein [Pseudomonadota bacterium]